MSFERKAALHQMSWALRSAAERVACEVMKSAITKLDLQIIARRFSSLKIAITALGVGGEAMVAAGKLGRAEKMYKSTHKTAKCVGPLKNRRQEAFAHHVAEGCSASEAYSIAYGRQNDPTARTNGHRLLMNANIRCRIDEFRREIMQEAADAYSAIVSDLEKAALSQIKTGHLRSACRTAGRIVSLAERLERALMGTGTKR